MQTLKNHNYYCRCPIWVNQILLCSSWCVVFNKIMKCTVWDKFMGELNRARKVLFTWIKPWKMHNYSWEYEKNVIPFFLILCWLALVRKNVELAVNLIEVGSFYLSFNKWCFLRKFIRIKISNILPWKFLYRIMPLVWIYEKYRIFCLTLFYRVNYFY